MFSRRNKKTALVFLVFLLSACASSSLFISYPSQFRSHLVQLDQGKASSASEALAKKGSGPNSLLNALESARLAQLAGDHELSKQQYRRAFAYFDEADNKARLSLADGGALLASMAVNDNTFPYEAEAYERIFAHHYQSMNYLAMGDRQAALVEIRRANEEQVFALEQHHKELAKAEQEAQENDISPDIEQYEEQLRENLTAAAKVKNSFQNAYTFYYSALIREADNDLNGAYIDYKKALEIQPDNHYLQADAWRLAKRLGMDDDLQHFRSFFSKAAMSQAQAGNIIIFFENSLVPQKEEIFLPFDTLRRVYTFAFPAYLTPWQASSPVHIRINGETQGYTDKIIDTHALAAKALQEGAFTRLLRQMLRINAKSRLQEQAMQNDDSGLQLFFSQVYSMVSERADLRSWLSLPRQVQIARLHLEQGSHTIQLGDATFSHTINVTIDDDTRHLIHLGKPGSHIYQHHYRF